MAIIHIKKGDRDIQPLLDRAKLGDTVILDWEIWDDWPDWIETTELYFIDKIGGLNE